MKQNATLGTGEALTNICMTITELITDGKEQEDKLQACFQEFQNGGNRNPEFLNLAHKVYNEYATFPCMLPTADRLYLLGIIFSEFAPSYSDDINIYTSIMEDALFCFFKMIRTSTSVSEKQCAAIRMLLLIEDNDWVMKGITRKFRDKYSQELYGQPSFMTQMISQGMEPWSYEEDILRMLGAYCIYVSDSNGKHSYISHSEMQQFHQIKQSGKYELRWPLVNMSMDSVFDLYYQHIFEIINTPFERRITKLRCF